MADEAARRVYHWEEAFVEPRQSAADRLLTTDQCRDYVFRACAATGTRLPTIKFTKASHSPCKADLVSWQVILAEWGHSALTVLHETAHLATYESVRRGENGHGPSFVRMAIEFYSGFLGINRDFLLQSAERCGVFVGPPVSRISIPSNLSPFSDLEF
ncbi:SprT family zinc-dependent metalloprotease [Rhizobium laguerreae]|uniref:SprT-like domain-containing protein n=1 Tax=Rhizobium laguerreae TaxID=1076926 RepID=UPI001C91522B|nr:SprT-like domain-containing protein [Rhizobium laguerreae]MBY3151168.1 SprT family zinc-dependent metalloprotease [Rhizobium laguerreae]